MVSTQPEEPVAAAAAAPASRENEAKKNTVANNDDPIVQYILVRTDLKWGTGAMIAQACHASIAAIAGTLSDKTTKDYLDDLANMHKVILKAEKLEHITEAEVKLKEADIAYHAWVEQPENVVSCLACSPQRKPLVQAIFKHLKLLR